MTDTDTEEPELLDRLEQGDREALAILFARHRDRLRRMVEFRLHPQLQRRIDPDDVLQDAYVAALARIGTFDRGKDPSSYLWLRLIVAQTMVDLHREHLGARMRDARQEVALGERTGPRVASETMSFQLSGSLPSPSAVAQRAETATLLRSALDAMDEIDREVLVLRHLEELSNLDTARILGLQPSAASNRYVRALARLKELLERRAGFGT